MKKWRCTVCGYIHEGDSPPDTCPNCGASKDKFVEMADGQASIHMNQGNKISYGTNPEVNPFFGDYEGIQPFIYNLPAGSHIPLHKHPTTDELFYIIRGKFRFMIGDKEIVAAAGDLIQGRMDIPHTFENIGDEPGAFLSVKGPKPVDRIMLEE